MSWKQNQNQNQNSNFQDIYKSDLICPSWGINDELSTEIAEINRLWKSKKLGASKSHGNIFNMFSNPSTVGGFITQLNQVVPTLSIARKEYYIHPSFGGTLELTADYQGVAKLLVHAAAKQGLILTISGNIISNDDKFTLVTENTIDHFTMNRSQQSILNANESNIISSYAIGELVTATGQTLFRKVEVMPTEEFRLIMNKAKDSAMRKNHPTAFAKKMTIRRLVKNMQPMFGIDKIILESLEDKAETAPDEGLNPNIVSPVPSPFPQPQQPVQQQPAPQTPIYEWESFNPSEMRAYLPKIIKTMAEKSATETEFKITDTETKLCMKMGVGKIEELSDEQVSGAVATLQGVVNAQIKKQGGK